MSTLISICVQLHQFLSSRLSPVVCLHFETAHQSARSETSVRGENLSIQVFEVFGGRVLTGWICQSRRGKN